MVEKHWQGTTNRRIHSSITLSLFLSRLKTFFSINYSLCSSPTPFGLISMNFMTIFGLMVFLRYFLIFSYLFLIRVLDEADFISSPAAR